MPVACSPGQRGTSIRNYALLTRATGMKIGEALYAAQAVYGQYEILTPAYDIEPDELYTLGGSARLGGVWPGDSGGGGGGARPANVNVDASDDPRAAQEFWRQMLSGRAVDAVVILRCPVRQRELDVAIAHEHRYRGWMFVHYRFLMQPVLGPQHANLVIIDDHFVVFGIHFGGV